MCLSGCSEYWLFGTNIYKPRKACCDRQLGVLPTSFLACFYNSLFPSWVHWIKNLISCQNIVESWSELAQLILLGSQQTEQKALLSSSRATLCSKMALALESDLTVESYRFVQDLVLSCEYFNGWRFYSLCEQSVCIAVRTELVDQVREHISTCAFLFDFLWT